MGAAAAADDFRTRRRLVPKTYGGSTCTKAQHCPRYDGSPPAVERTSTSALQAHIRLGERRSKDVSGPGGFAGAVRTTVLGLLQLILIAQNDRLRELTSRGVALSPLPRADLDLAQAVRRPGTSGKARARKGWPERPGLCSGRRATPTVMQRASGPLRPRSTSPTSWRAAPLRGDDAVTW